MAGADRQAREPDGCGPGYGKADALGACLRSIEREGGERPQARRKADAVSMLIEARKKLYGERLARMAAA